MTSTNQDVDWITVFDFDSDIACENVKANCDNKAEWRYVLRCCGTVYLICTPCKNRSMRWFKMCEKTKATVTCTTCGYESKAKDFKIDWEPL